MPVSRDVMGAVTDRATLFVTNRKANYSITCAGGLFQLDQRVQNEVFSQFGNPAARDEAFASKYKSTPRDYSIFIPTVRPGLDNNHTITTMQFKYAAYALYILGFSTVALGLTTVCAT